MRYLITLLIILSASLCVADSIDDLLRDGKFYEAEKKLYEKYGSDVNVPEYIFLQGKESLSGESSAGRLKDYINKSTEDTYVPDWARILLGKYYMSLGLYVTARNQLGSIPIGSPFYNEAEYLAAKCYMLSGEYEDAILAYGEILAQSHHNEYLPWAKLGTGDAFYEMHNYRKAEEFYKELIESAENDNVYALALLGMVDLARTHNDTRNAAYYYDIYESRFGKGITMAPIEQDETEEKPGIRKEPERQIEQPVQPQTKGRYYIQVGAFSKKDNALHLADLYRESGYKVYMETFVENGKEFYRILVGGYTSKQQAKFIQKRLENAMGEKYILLTR